MNDTSYEKHVDYLIHLKHAGMLWYLVNPYESTFEFTHQVPDYQRQVWLPFFVLILLEQIIICAKKQSAFRLNDHVTSFSHWIFQESARIFCRGAEYYLYLMIYEKYRFWSLPWNSPWTWYLTAIGVDFCYYWVHRANHEIHFLWAHHQVHHSSEEFNLAVGLRQSILQHWCSFAFYLPLACFIPPSHFIAHHQFNLIYQLWIHTTVINDLGILELILNTPKHHRVHHGCNLYCLDTNYGGVLIIWDRLFGTFVEEKPKEEIIYGLVVSPQSFNPLYLQVFYMKDAIMRSISMKTFSDKLGVLWKGPSWFPGMPRLGLDEFKINVTSRIKYDTYLPTWQKLYIIMHFCIAFYAHCQLYDDRSELRDIGEGTLILNNIFALTTIGLLFDKFAYAHIVEFIRCVIYLLFIHKKDYSDASLMISSQFIYYVHILSCCIWICYALRKIAFPSKS